MRLPHDIGATLRLASGKDIAAAGLASWPGHPHMLFTADKRMLQKGPIKMFSAKQYRAKAAEFRALLTNMPLSPNEMSEFRNLEQTYTTLAENDEWMTTNIDKRIHRGEGRGEASL
jgi:hypothetical protein